MKPNKKALPLYIIIGVVAITAGIILMPPVTDWGTKIITFILAALLVAYLGVFVAPKLSKTASKQSRVIGLVEFVAILIIIVLFILAGFEAINFSINACGLLGLVIFLHGVVSLIVKYFYNTRNKYSLLFYILDIALVTIGTYIFAKPPFSDEQIIWATSIILLVVGVISFVYLIIALQDKKQK